MAESNFDHGHLIQIISKLTRLIQLSEKVTEERIEYEYRDAECEREYETIPEN